MSHAHSHLKHAGHTIEGSHRPPAPGAKVSSPPPSSEEVRATIVVKGQNQPQFHAHLQRLHAGEQAHLTHEQFDQQFGASTDDIKAVTAFAQQHGLKVVDSHAGRRSVQVTGTVEQMASAFGVQFVTYEHGSVKHRGYTGSVQVPAELAGVVEHVLGLDNRPVAQPRIRRNGHGGHHHHHPTQPTQPTDPSATSAAASKTFTPLQVAALYGFPAGHGSSSYNIALIELGGGFNASQLSTYFSSLKVSPAPTVVAVSVDGAKNTTGSDADGEVQLDIEVAGAIANAATIAVYFAPNTDAGFLDAITQATHDTTYKPAVISISWGGPEDTWTSATMNSFDSALASAAVLGVSSFVASGDSGSTDGETGTHVDFPASSPHATGCGGTTLTGSGTTISKEVVWNGSGGGVSVQFALPTWQAKLKATTAKGVATTLAKRGVPDVAGNADPNSGYNVSVDGTAEVVGGTSAVAPLWAALTAVQCAISNKRLGLVNPTLYANPTHMRDITSGNNTGFEATAGWDACTGLGSIRSTSLTATTSSSSSSSGSQ